MHVHPPRPVLPHVRLCGKLGGRGGKLLLLMAAVNLEGSNPLELLMDLVCRSSLTLTHTHTEQRAWLHDPSVVVHSV